MSSGPIKWLRRNNKKIMAVVVIVLMFAFIGGSALSYMLQPSGGNKKAFAYYGKSARITPMMIHEASVEIEILQALQADAVLQQQDLRGVLLGELLFSQSRGSPAVMNQVMQMIRRNQFLISDKQLSEMYERTQSPAVYWILLTNEAESAGIRVPTADVGNLLGRIVPQLFRGQSYSAVMNGIVNRFRASEKDILEAFGRMLAVLQYAQTICSVEDVTIPQLTHMASRSGSTLDAEVVQLPARAFIDKQNPPTDDALKAQFDKYKGNFAGNVTEDNPFGFGYKLPDRIQLDYVALKLQDVAGIVPVPTQEEAEVYYRQNRQRLYTQEVPSDPNDPNSPKVQKVTSYAEVAETIMEQLRKQRIITKAEQMLEQVRTAADANLAVVTPEEEAKKPEAQKPAGKPGDYNQIAEKIAKDYAIPVFSGQTGWLSAVDMQMDKYLGRLIVANQGASALRLSQILFSVKELGEDAAILMFAQTARTHATIGPASDPMVTMSPDLSGQIMLVARISGVSKASEPENYSVTFSTRTLNLGDTSAKKKDEHSVREKVTQDVQKLAAWDAAKGKAQEFVALAQKEGWDPAIAKFNDLYGGQAKEDPNDPNVFKLDRLNDLQRISNVQLQVVATQTIGNPAAATIASETRVEKQLVDRFYSLVPDNADTAPNLPQVIEFKPSQSFYAVKNITVRWLNQQQYESMKGMLLQQEDFMQTQNLAAVHFNPANILKRMNFRLARPEESAQKADAAEKKSKDAA